MAKIKARQIDTGTGANQVVELDGSSKLPAVDGSALTNVAAGASAPQYKTKTGSTSRASTTTLAADPHLAGFLLQPSSSYRIECNLLFDGQGSTTNGFKFAPDFNGQDSNVVVIRPFYFASDEGNGFATNHQNASQVISWTTTFPINITAFRASTDIALHIDAIIETNGSYTADTALDLSWAQYSSSGTNTRLQTYSTMIVTEITAP